MTNVDISGRIILNDAAVPSSFVVVPMLWGSSAAWPLEAENRRYAGGALRQTAALRPVDVWSPAPFLVTSAAALELVRRAGTTHLARDAVGQRIACVWASPDVQWQGPAKGALVSALVTLTLERTDWDEAV